MSRIGQALALAAEVHADQTDWQGNPYFDHAYEVRRRARERYAQLRGFRWRPSGDNARAREDVEIVALLHDALEDMDGNDHDKRQLRDAIYREFGSDVYAAVDALTKLPDDDYERDYIPRVERNWIARVVKLADLSHNLDVWRMPPRKIKPRDYERWAKYHRAFVRLMRSEQEVST